MKVLHLIPGFHKGGSERMLIDICEGSVNRGIKTKIIHFENAQTFQFRHPVEIFPCKAHVQKSIFRKSIVELKEYQKIVDDFQPDIIHSHSFYTDIISREILRKDILYISHFHLFIHEFQNFSLGIFKSKKALTTYIDRQILFKKYSKFRNTLFITVSDASDNYYKKRLPKSLHKNIYKLPNAIKLDLFKTQERVLSSDDEVVLITVGRLVKEKNHLFLIEVIEYLKRTGIKARLIILGSGAFMNELKKEVIKKKLENEVEILGAVDQVETWLKKAHIYVHSSLSETFGISILEAMASGLPCVALDAIGNRELVKDGINGFLLKSVNVKMFSDRIIQLLNSKTLYSSMSKQALVHSTNYNLTSYMNCLEGLYKNGLKNLHFTQ